jgi:tetratricopeptide (TPR) repeat protein
MNRFTNSTSHCDPDKVGRSNLIKLTGLLGYFVPHNNMIMLITIIVFIFSFLSLGELSAQSTRGIINDGVELYDEQQFSDAEVNFKKGTELDPENFEAKFNLGDAYYKQQRYDEAIKSFQEAYTNAITEEQKAKIHYNVGNSLLKSQKLDESISSYKESLKINPNDQEAKYNLSYALNMKNNQDQQQDQQQQNDKNQDQNQDQQNKDQNQDQQQQNQEQEQQDQESQQDNTKQQQKEPQISKEEAERILNALEDNEKDLQKELRKIKGRRVKTEKDW